MSKYNQNRDIGGGEEPIFGWTGMGGPLVFYESGSTAGIIGMRSLTGGALSVPAAVLTASCLVSPYGVSRGTLNTSWMSDENFAGNAGILKLSGESLSSSSEEA
jgi:hypothetical protein